MRGYITSAQYIKTASHHVALGWVRIPNLAFTCSARHGSLCHATALFLNICNSQGESLCTYELLQVCKAHQPGLPFNPQRVHEWEEIVIPIPPCGNWGAWYYITHLRPYCWNAELELEVMPFGSQFCLFGFFLPVHLLHLLEATSLLQFHTNLYPTPVMFILQNRSRQIDMQVYNWFYSNGLTYTTIKKQTSQHADSTIIVLW